MEKIRIVLYLFCASVLGACDLKPKITALPDTVGEFISARYPALLADPYKQPEIYNSAAGDYGVYASPELYGPDDSAEYVNYTSLYDYGTEYAEYGESGPLPPQELAEQPDDIVMPDIDDDNEDIEPNKADETVTVVEQTPESESTPEPDSGPVQEPSEEQASDVLSVPEYETPELYVPARAVPGTIIVHRGDTLYAIARANDVKMEDLAKENNLVSPYVLRPNQVLKLPIITQDVKPNESEPKPVVVSQKKPEPITPKPVNQKQKVQHHVAPEPEIAKKIETPKPVARAKSDVRVPVKTITVAKGDTLYSLSRKYQIPVNDLAVMNGIGAPFALTVGQTLRVPDLGHPVTSKSDTKKSEPQKNVAPKTAQSKQVKAVNKKVEVKQNQKVETKKTEPKKNNAKPVKQAGTDTLKKTSKPKPANKKQAANPKPKSEPQKIAARSASKFTWPVRGTILSHFGAKMGGLYNDGINISASPNTVVSAAENGVVAYAGNEIRGMGNLVIIQHSDGWMTVYAHMNSMSVRRGVRVSVGQKIGTVGQTGKVNSPQLHFEIRKGTKPYNPINYLKK